MEAETSRSPRQEKQGGEGRGISGGDFLTRMKGPRTVSRGCKEELCSGTGRRRWRGHRCTWAEVGHQSNSEEDTEKERQERRGERRKKIGEGGCVRGGSEVRVWVNPAFEPKWIEMAGEGQRSRLTPPPPPPSGSCTIGHLQAGRTACSYLVVMHRL